MGRPGLCPEPTIHTTSQIISHPQSHGISQTPITTTHHDYPHPFLPTCLRLGVLLSVSVLGCSCRCLPASVSARSLPVPPPALLACLPPALLACLLPSCPRCLFGPF